MSFQLVEVRLPRLMALIILFGELTLLTVHYNDIETTKGTLFHLGPSGLQEKNEFYLQDFPPVSAIQVGRRTVELWNQSKITAVVSS